MDWNLGEGEMNFWNDSWLQTGKLNEYLTDQITYGSKMRSTNILRTFIRADGTLISLERQSLICIIKEKIISFGEPSPNGDFSYNIRMIGSYIKVL